MPVSVAEKLPFSVLQWLAVSRRNWQTVPCSARRACRGWTSPAPASPTGPWRPLRRGRGRPCSSRIVALSAQRRGSPPEANKWLITGSIFWYRKPIPSRSHLPKKIIVFPCTNTRIFLLIQTFFAAFSPTSIFAIIFPSEEIFRFYFSFFARSSHYFHIITYLFLDVLREGVQLLANVLGEGLHQQGVRRPTIDDGPGHASWTPGT